MKLINKDDLKETEINSYFHKVRVGIFNEKGKMYITNMDNSFNLPGGRIEEKEDINKALLREIHEELGIKLSLEDIRYLGNFKFYHKNFPYNDSFVNRENEIELFIVNKPYPYCKEDTDLTDYEKSFNFKIMAVDLNDIDSLLKTKNNNKYKEFNDVELEYLCNIIKEQRSDFYA